MSDGHDHPDDHLCDQESLTGNHTTVIEAPVVQLMGDDLKEIEKEKAPWGREGRT
jgi:hypothetical protein